MSVRISRSTTRGENQRPSISRILTIVGFIALLIPLSIPNIAATESRFIYYKIYATEGFNNQVICRGQTIDIEARILEGNSDLDFYRVNVYCEEEWPPSSTFVGGCTAWWSPVKDRICTDNNKIVPLSGGALVVVITKSDGDVIGRVRITEKNGL